MQSLRHLFPSAGRLIVFEAAGRLGSFTAAGRELGMSQAAVSYAVRGLEDHLGVALFRRGYRQVTLTGAGARFLDDVTLGLGHIRKSAEDLRQAAGMGHVTLAASTAFASFWMMPRLQQLRDDLPGVELRLHTSERDLDLRTEGMPLGIRGGHPAEWPDHDSAVAAPRYVRQHGLPGAPQDLTGHRLIHLAEPYRTAATWADWFGSAGLPPAMVPRGLVINDYALVIQAVMEGQGIALGWQHLTGRLVEAGFLVPVAGHVMRTGRGFHVVWPRAIPLGPAAGRVRDWLIARA
jgi:DNA-binding transcriptional LysR family regulator